MGCFGRAAYGFMGDAVVLRDLAEGFALLYAVEHIEPLFGGNTILWICRAGASLLAFLLKRRVPVSRMTLLSVCHGIIILDTGKTGTDGVPFRSLALREE